MDSTAITKTNIWKVNDETWVIADTIKDAIEICMTRNPNQPITKVDCVQMNVLIKSD